MEFQQNRLSNEMRNWGRKNWQNLVELLSDVKCDLSLGKWSERKKLSKPFFEELFVDVTLLRPVLSHRILSRFFISNYISNRKLNQINHKNVFKKLWKIFGKFSYFLKNLVKIRKILEKIALKISLRFFEILTFSVDSSYFFKNG